MFRLLGGVGWEEVGSQGKSASRNIQASATLAVNNSLIPHVRMARIKIGQSRVRAAAGLSIFRAGAIAGSRARAYEFPLF
jgi:hypothetical protein